jgi:hypothetical protein
VVSILKEMTTFVVCHLIAVKQSNTDKLMYK